MKEAGIIRNPLTVIAIFAGLAETGGTVVLPFLQGATQETYIWFLMLFPVFLVLLFFGTLWAKHQVLYAPSDFKDESHFIRALKPAPEELVRSKIESDASSELPKDAIDLGIDAQKSETSNDTDISKPKRKTKVVTDRYIENARRAETLSVKALSKELDVSFVSNVISRNGQSKAFVLDAVGHDGENEIVAEIKYVESADRLKLSATNGVKYVQRYYSSLSEIARMRSRLYIIVACGDNAIEPAAVQYDLHRTLPTGGVPVEFRVYRVDQLIQEFGNP